MHPAVKRLGLAARTVRYLTPGQVFWRAYMVTSRVVRQKVLQLFLPSPQIGEEIEYRRNPYGLQWPVGDEGRLTNSTFFRIGEADEVVAGRFRFLNQVEDLGRHPVWNDASRPKLWTYNLHYFDYGLQLAMGYKSTGDERYCDRLKELVTAWIRENPVGAGNGWEPYTVSLRVVNWIKVYSLVGDSIALDEEFQEAFIESLYLQARYLRGHLERHLLANHYMENLVTLVAAGAFFQTAEAEKWFGFALSRLWKQVQQQVTVDGCHFEMSPMYHLIMMRGILETMVLCRALGELVPKQAVETLRRMAWFSRNTVHPDGHIPLLNDAAHGIALEPSELIPAVAAFLGDVDLAQGFPQPSLYAAHLLGNAKLITQSRQQLKTAAEHPENYSGYVVFRGDGDHLVFDVASVGPDFNPGHAHADTLSFECSLAGKRVFVDSGVYEYNQGLWRNYFRSTQAHNTVEVDGQNQSEVWASFRVGRRARARLISHGKQGGMEFAVGYHDGYLRLKDPVAHYRTIVHDTVHDLWLSVDALLAKDEHQYVSRLHLAPGLDEVEPQENVVTVGEAAYVQCSGFDEITVETAGPDISAGWVSEQFGVLLPSKVVLMRKVSSGATCFGTMFGSSPQIAKTRLSVEFSPPKSLVVRYSFKGRPTVININLSASGAGALQVLTERKEQVVEER